MPRDLPDWGALSAQSTVHEVTDLGELAVRLGSVVSFDRRGDVVWMDEFECGLDKWTVDSTGTDASIALSTDAARNGDTSVKMVSGSAGLVVNTLSHYQPFAALSRFGFEYSLNVTGIIDKMMWRLDVYDGTNLSLFIVRWDDVNNLLQYLDSGGSYVTFRTGVTLSVLAGLFHTGKLVVDADSGEYVRFILDSVESDLSGFGGQVSVNAALAHLRLIVDFDGTSGDNDVVYIDDVILTQNEPT